MSPVFKDKGNGNPLSGVWKRREALATVESLGPCQECGGEVLRKRILRVELDRGIEVSVKEFLECGCGTWQVEPEPEPEEE